MHKVYEKKVNNVRHLFFTETGVPAQNDVQLDYTDKDGGAISPVLEDKFECGPEHSISWAHGETTKELQAWADDYNIIPGGLERPAPASGFRHTMRMYANDGSHDSEFHVIVNNDDETEFTLQTLEVWLRENGYTTANDNYYNNIENVAGPEIDGVASKAEGVVVVNFKGTGAGANVDSFISDTVTPAN